MTALPDWDVASDGELACAAAVGDRAALGGIYDRYADRLHDFCIGMLRDREAAADCVQETFCTAAVELTKLRDPDSLRPWLYAVARNEALRHLRRRRREDLSDELPELASSEVGPDTLAARSELAGLIAEAEGGLSDRDRAVLELSYRHGLDALELAEALDVSLVNAAKLVSRLRDTIERSLGALLVARRAQRTPGGCAELAEILGNWDGQFSVLMRKRIARHIDSCTSCERDRRDLVNPKSLLGVAPILIAAPWWLRGQTLTKVQLTSFDTHLSTLTDSAATVPAANADHQQHAAASGAVDADDPAKSANASQMRWLWPVAALVAIFVVALGLTFAWLSRQHTSVTPSDVTEIKSAPTETALPSALPPAPANPRTGSLPVSGRGPDATWSVSVAPQPNNSPEPPAQISAPPAGAPAAPPQPVLAPVPVPVKPPNIVPPQHVSHGPGPTSQSPAPSIHNPVPAAETPAPTHRPPTPDAPSLRRNPPAVPSVPAWHPRAQ